MNGRKEGGGRKVEMKGMKGGNYSFYRARCFPVGHNKILEGLPGVHAHKNTKFRPVNKGFIGHLGNGNANSARIQQIDRQMI